MSVESRRPVVPMPAQPIVVSLEPDLSGLERQIAELTARIDAALTYIETPGAYTPTQAAELLQVNRKRVYEAIQTGKIRAVQIGRQWRIPAASLRDWLATGDTPTTEPIRLAPAANKTGPRQRAQEGSVDCESSG